MLVCLELANNELRLDFEDFEPKSLSLLLNSVLVSSKQRLLINFLFEDIIEIFGNLKYICQRLVTVDKLYRAAHD